MKRAPLILKLGGELLEQPDDVARVARGIAALARKTRLVVVHGGGKEIDAALATAGIPKVQVDGVRVTDRATLDVVVAVLAAHAEWALRTGHEVRLEVRAYDPMDPLSGRYLAVPLAIELPGAALPRDRGRYDPGDHVWIRLERGDPWWRPVSIHRSPPFAGTVAIRARVVTGATTTCPPYRLNQAVVSWCDASSSSSTRWAPAACG